MAHFCTKCGTVYSPGARFCDECGNTLPAAAPAAASPAAPAKPAPTGVKRRHAVLAGGVLAALIVAGGALAWLLAPEAASASSFSRAIEAHLNTDTSARDKLICLSNLPYQKEEIRVASYDSGTRQWLDVLVRSGLYSGPVEQATGGWLSQSQFVYTIAAPGKAAVHDGKLCLARGLKVASVSGYEQVREVGGQKVAMATAKLALTDEAAWLSASPERASILQHLPQADLEVDMPLVLIDKKWQVAEHGQVNSFAMAAAMDNSPVAQGMGVLQKLKNAFSFGAHPLVGKWTSGGNEFLEFTSDSVIEKKRVTKATFNTDGNVVTIVVEGEHRAEMVAKLSNNNNTAQLFVGGMLVAIVQRVQD